MARNQSATADILSQCLIHKILCCLSYEEAFRMRVLSKTWLQAWLTLPNLKFKVEYNLKGAKIVDAIMERYRDDKIPIDKFEFSNCSRSTDSDQFFSQINKWLDIALQNGIKDIVYGNPHRLAPSYPFPIIRVLAAKSLRELVLSGCDLMHVSLLSSGVTNCHTLRKLSLTCVSLNENILQTLLNSCPLIVSFILDTCWRLEKIELLSLRKIKTIYIRAIENQCVKIQLAPTLEHLSYSSYGYSLEKLDVVECQNLKSLELNNVRISDGYLQNLISRSQNLKLLKIWYCEGVTYIDSSNLLSLEYTGDQIPELKLASESSQLKHSKIGLKCYNNLNAAWFCKLRKLLSNLTSSSQVSIDFSVCNEINMKDLQLHHKVATQQVDILNVNVKWPTVECPTFVDALLWSCHPRRLNLSSSTFKMKKWFIDRLMYMKNPSRSPSPRSNPWHSQLKEIKAFDGKNQPLQLRSGKLAMSTLTEWRKVYFLLDW